MAPLHLLFIFLLIELEPCTMTRGSTAESYLTDQLGLGTLTLL